MFDWEVLGPNQTCSLWGTWGRKAKRIQLNILFFLKFWTVKFVMQGTNATVFKSFVRRKLKAIDSKLDKTYPISRINTIFECLWYPRFSKFWAIFFALAVCQGFYAGNKRKNFQKAYVWTSRWPSSDTYMKKKRCVFGDKWVANSGNLCTIPDFRHFHNGKWQNNVIQKVQFWVKVFFLASEKLR